jgi:hypothetical protein
MTLAEELAHSCCSRQKRADDLTGLRDDFEGSALREQALREHAQRLEELAASRAAREDTSPAGYAGTAAKRLIPIPHTGGEALARIPAMIAGGMAGHHFGKQFEPMDPTMLEQVLSPNNEKGLEGLGKQIESLRPAAAPPSAPGLGSFPAVQGPRNPAAPHLRPFNGAINAAQNAAANAQPPVSEVSKLLTELQTTPGKQVSDALRERALPGMPRPGADLRKKMVGLVGEGQMGRLRSAFGRHLDPEKSLASRLSRYRVGGAVGGALGAGALVGLPFVIRALLQKRQGGEAAVRARGQAGEATSKAQGESQHREDILNKLPAEASA